MIRKCLRSGECPQVDDLRYGVYTIIEIAWTLSCGFDESPIDAINEGESAEVDQIEIDMQGFLPELRGIRRRNLGSNLRHRYK